MKVLHRRCAGLDVHKDEVVAVGSDPVNALDPVGLFKSTLAKGYQPDKAHGNVVDLANAAQKSLVPSRAAKDLFKDFYGTDEARLLQLLGESGPTMELTEEGGMGWAGSCVNGVPRAQAKWLSEEGKEAIFQAAPIHELAHYLSPWYHALIRPALDPTTAQW
jgi:hypothetical protein